MFSKCAIHSVAVLYRMRISLPRRPGSRGWAPPGGAPATVTFITVFILWLLDGSLV